MQSSNGSLLTVVKCREIHGYTKTHNLTVDEVHTFYVVANGTAVLVHNQPPTIHNLGEDWIKKGAHVDHKGVEIGIRGGAGTHINLKNLHPNKHSTAQVSEAMKSVREALKDPKWRARLAEQARRGTAYLGQGAGLPPGSPSNVEARAQSGSTRALQVTLGRFCP